MGYDIYAYLYVNQSKIENFINENQIDRKNYDQRERIVEYYKELNPEVKEFEILYVWNRKCEIHDFFVYYGTNFIRDDDRLSNRRYHLVLEEKHQQAYPYCLININMYLRTTKDAIEIADGLTIFFGDDECLMDFADWLKKTSKHCSIYELSY